MKEIYTLILSLLTLACFSQSTEGAVTYETIIKIDVSRFPPEVKDMIPSERKSKSQLIFNSKESLYKTVKEDKDINEEVSSVDGNRVRFRTQGRGDSEYYTNLEKGLAVNKTEFLGRTFLVDGGEKIEWKVTGEMEMIAGYQCMKATFMQDTIPVVAWFTPQIPISFGPGRYAGLPGLVLSVDIREGGRTIVASSVDLRALTEGEVIAAPDKGKKISREDFKELQMEKAKEMMEMRGGQGSGGSFIIRN